MPRLALARRIIGHTEKAIDLLLQQLEHLKIENAIFYLDASVSNSGRLSTLIKACGGKHDVSVTVQVINNVDRVLEQQDGVISSDAIILNKCISWLNIMPVIMEQLEAVWMIRLQCLG